MDDVCKQSEMLEKRGQVDIYKLKDACDAVLREWEDDFIEELKKRKDNESFNQHFCYDFSKMCEGVDMDEFIGGEYGKIMDLMQTGGQYGDVQFMSMMGDDMFGGMGGFDDDFDWEKYEEELLEEMNSEEMEEFLAESREEAADEAEADEKIDL